MIAEALAGKRIAVTGSTGFLGTALVERLLRPGKGSLSLVLRDGAVVQVGPSYVKQVQRALAAGTG